MSSRIFKLKWAHIILACLLLRSSGAFIISSPEKSCSVPVIAGIHEQQYLKGSSSGYILANKVDTSDASALDKHQNDAFTAHAQ